MTCPHCGDTLHEVVWRGKVATVVACQGCGKRYAVGKDGKGL